ncbi:hypothetical protein P8452_08394 [Trifolium repens]|nr:hypothetical protein P8452_08394 [Trifolium repens]
MASSSSSSRNVMIYAVDDAEPIIVDGSNFVSEPDMTSVEDNIWGEELLIPHKLRGRTLAFAGPLPSSDNFTEDAIETGFAALQQRTPKGKSASKAKGATTSTDTTTPGATQKKTLPNTGAKVRKRNLMASSEAEGPIKQKKQKALTIQEPSIHATFISSNYIYLIKLSNPQDKALSSIIHFPCSLYKIFLLQQTVSVVVGLNQ